ncbi:MAG TPA: hypothetical protein PKG60_16495 [Spirochaetota bacterium]|nr:hypothetical protein [Spirochaetota bacterium]
MLNISISGLFRMIIYDILFSLFVVFIEPHLLPELKNYSNYAYDRPTLWIGILILAALAAEVPGVYLKFRSIGSRMLNDGSGKPGESISLKWGMLPVILHTAIGVIVMLSAFRAFGLNFYRDENLFRVFFLAALAREGFIIYFIFTAKIPHERIKDYTLKNTIADLCLFFFSIIAFTATWRVIPESGKTLHADSSFEMIILVFFTSILFLMFYLSSNMTSIYENFITARTRKQLSYRFGSLILVLACVLYPMLDIKKTENHVLQGYTDSELKEKMKTEKELLRQSRIKDIEKTKSIKQY